MKKLFQKIFGAEDGENGQVAMLLLQGFFAGIFVASYDVGAGTLFIGMFDDSYVPKAFIASGLLGIAFTTLLVKLQDKLKYGRIAIVFLFLASFVVSVLFAGMLLFPGKWIVFTAFMMMGPINSLVLLLFWGVFFRMFNLRQTKRLSGGIDAGQGIATILAFFTIPIVQELWITEVVYFFLTAAVCMFAVAFCALWIVYRYPFVAETIESVEVGDLSEVENKSNKSNKLWVIELFEDPFTSKLALFTLLSAISVAFVQYSFLSVTGSYYANEKDLANFLGVFSGTVIVIGFLIQFFLSDKILEMYGLKNTLLILPGLLAILTVIVVAVGHLWGYTASSPTFVFFFLIVAISKLFSASLRDTVDASTFKMYFLPLPVRIRLGTQAKVDGTIKESASFLAGILLLSLGSFEFIKLIHYSYFIFFLITAWMVVVGKMHFQYKETLKQTLVRQKEASKSAKPNEYTVIKMLMSHITEGNPRTVVFSMDVLRHLDPLLYASSLSGLLKNPDVRVLEYALKSIQEDLLLEYFNELNNLKKHPSKSVSDLAKQCSDTLGKKAESLRSTVDLMKAAASPYKAERQIASKIIGYQVNAKNADILQGLLRDIDLVTRYYALLSAGRFKSPVFWQTLVESLAVAECSNAAAASLVSIGPEVLPLLESAFYKTDQKQEVLILIIYVYRRLGDESVEFLWSKIDFPDQKVNMQALIALAAKDCTADALQAPKLKQAISEKCKNIAWNLAALQEVKPADLDGTLQEAVQQEIDNAYEHVFLLLTLLYDSQSIQLVKENLKTNTMEGIEFALQLMEVFMDEELKPMLFTLFSDLPDEEKISRMQFFFPKPAMEAWETVRYLINRDYNTTNRWTKACALQNLSLKHKAGEATEIDFIANLFNEDPMLHEIAAWAVLQGGEDELARQSERIGGKMFALEYRLKNIKEEGKNLSLRFNMVREFAKIGALRYVPGALLSKMAEIAVLYEVRPNTELVFTEGSLKNFIFVPVMGRVGLFKGNVFLREVKHHEIIGDIEAEEELVYSLTYKTMAQSTLYRIKADDFYLMMLSHYEILNSIFAFIEEEGVPQIEARS